MFLLMAFELLHNLHLGMSKVLAQCVISFLGSYDLVQKVRDAQHEDRSFS